MFVISSVYSYAEVSKYIVTIGADFHHFHNRTQAIVSDWKNSQFWAFSRVGDYYCCIAFSDERYEVDYNGYA